jgi:hypothetical protein
MYIGLYATPIILDLSVISSMIGLFAFPIHRCYLCCDWRIAGGRKLSHPFKVAIKDHVDRCDNDTFSDVLR